MCLPLKFLKVVTRYAAYAFAAIGVGIILLSLIHADTFIYGLGLAGGVYICLSACCGFIGQKYHSCCCLLLFNCSQISIVFIILIVTYFDRKYEMIVEVEKAEQQFCKTDCYCYISPNTLWPSENYLISNNILYVQDPKYPVKYPECSNKKKTYDGVIFSLSEIELQYNCSGILNQSPIYLFSDVNRGAPKEHCGIFIDQYISDNPNRETISLYFFDIMAGFFCLCTLCICCRNQDDNDEDDDDQATDSSKNKIYRKILYRYFD